MSFLLCVAGKMQCGLWLLCADNALRWVYLYNAPQCRLFLCKGLPAQVVRAAKYSMCKMSADRACRVVFNK